jgi:hypothetical protein
MAIGLDDVIIIGRLFMAIKRWRKRRKLRKELEGIGMLDGRKTYIGILIAGVGIVLGWLGIGGEEEATRLVTHAAEIVGLLIAIYGRYAART